MFNHHRIFNGLIIIAFGGDGCNLLSGLIITDGAII